MTTPLPIPCGRGVVLTSSPRLDRAPARHVRDGV